MPRCVWVSGSTQCLPEAANPTWPNTLLCPRQTVPPNSLSALLPSTHLLRHKPSTLPRLSVFIHTPSHAAASLIGVIPRISQVQATSPSLLRSFPPGPQPPRWSPCLHFHPVHGSQPITPLSGFSLQRTHSPAPSHLQSPKDLDLPASPDFSAPQLPWPSPWVHGAHSGPPPGTLCPEAASSEGPPRTPDPTCTLHASQSPASAQRHLPSLGPTAVLPPSVSLSAFVLLLRWLICFLLICLLPTQEYLHKPAGLGAKRKRRCPSSNISKTCDQNRRSSMWTRVSAQASHLGASPSLPITPGRSAY